MEPDEKAAVAATFTLPEGMTQAEANRLVAEADAAQARLEQEQQET